MLVSHQTSHVTMKKYCLLIGLLVSFLQIDAQVNTERVLANGRNALYFEDYILSIQYFNQVIKAKPWMAEPYLYRAIAKLNLDDLRGAEEDCSLCLERNPFLSQAYYARGIARQSLELYDLAVKDYKKGLELRPDDKAMLSNQAIAYIQMKNYTDAEHAFQSLMKAYPKHSLGYLTRGAMYLERGDTALALADYDRAIDIDPYYAPCYGNRAIVYYQMNRPKEALADLNEAIRLNTRESGYYINRGLVRYQMNDFRGAMADYDQVIAMDEDNLIARFNRGLLRFQVGDNNRAIEDFDVVIAWEPDNYMAYYNRALLNQETGNHRGAVKDFDVVLKQYPNFIPGYYSRSESKRKMNDQAGADRDYWAGIRLEEKSRKGLPGHAAPASQTAQSSNDEANTREQSDKNIDKFNRLVVYDKNEQQQQKYQSEIRGRVQDRQVQIDLEPSFILTYYEKGEEVKEGVYYDKSVESYNKQQLLGWKLLITNREAALGEDQITAHFASINAFSAQIELRPTEASLYFGRAIDYLLVQDFGEAIQNFDRAIELDPTHTLAFFNRAAVRYKQMEYLQSQNQSSTYEQPALQFSLGKDNNPVAGLPNDWGGEDKKDRKAYEHELILRDYDWVIQQNPGFIYSYYNRGNIRCIQRDFRAAVVDYNEAILRNPEFAEAYFNRGLAYLSLGDVNRGITDLSKAGELGLLNAYSIIKRMTASN